MEFIISDFACYKNGNVDACNSWPAINLHYIFTMDCILCFILSSAILHNNYNNDSFYQNTCNLLRDVLKDTLSGFITCIASDIETEYVGIEPFQH